MKSEKQGNDAGGPPYELRTRAVALREVRAATSEKMLQLREEAMREREQAVARREQVAARLAQVDVGAETRLGMLQEANANLVIATLAAREQAEQIERAKARLDHLAHHDGLTGLPNRALMRDRMAQAIALAERQGTRLALMFMDMDGFKHINDSLGHAAGDKLLKSLAERLVAGLRQADTVCRYGGDEFVLLLAQIEGGADATVAALKILRALEAPHHVDGYVLCMTVSIGISVYPDSAGNAEGLMRCADTAMFHAKRQGGNTCQLFDAAMISTLVQRASAEEDLHTTLNGDQLVLYYQVRVDLLSGKPVGVEALVRWRHPEQGLLNARELASMTQDSRLIIPIGRWVLREACQQARRWEQAGLRPVAMAVNVSALELHAADFLAFVKTTLDDCGLAPASLQIEIRENALMRAAEANSTTLQGLADMGVRLAINGFGTGYTSLRQLPRFPADTLKLDHALIGHLDRSEHDASHVRVIIGIARSLSKSVIAEGIDRREQFDFLRANGCDQGQGDFLCQAGLPDAIGLYLQRASALP